MPQTTLEPVRSLYDDKLNNKYREVGNRKTYSTQSLAVRPSILYKCWIFQTSQNIFDREEAKVVRSGPADIVFMMKVQENQRSLKHAGQTKIANMIRLWSASMKSVVMPAGEENACSES